MQNRLSIVGRTLPHESQTVKRAEVEMCDLGTLVKSDTLVQTSVGTGCISRWRAQFNVEKIELFITY